MLSHFAWQYISSTSLFMVKKIAISYLCIYLDIPIVGYKSAGHKILVWFGMGSQYDSIIV